MVAEKKNKSYRMIDEILNANKSSKQELREKVYNRVECCFIPK